MATWLDEIDVNSDKYASMALDKDRNVAIQVEWGTITGTLTVWSSNLARPDKTIDAQWIDMGLTMPANPAGAAGRIFLNITGANSKHIRLKYAHTGATGTTTRILKAYIEVKP